MKKSRMTVKSDRDRSMARFLLVKREAVADGSCSAGSYAEIRATVGQCPGNDPVMTR